MSRQQQRKQEREEKKAQNREEREVRVKKIKSEKGNVPKIFTLLHYPPRLQIPKENVPEGFDAKSLDIGNEANVIKESLAELGIQAEAEVLRSFKGGFYIEINTRIPNWVADNFRGMGITVTERVQ